MSEAPIRKIIHVDMDAFYASVEQRDDPALRGLPVAVGGSRERGVVAAASYEARVFGVHSAMPSVTAKRKCPDLVFVKPRFDVYRAISRQIRAIFAEHTALIEPLSLDEAYLDVTENHQGIASATEIAERIRACIKAETGLTASAGVSYNKFLAKMASGQRKPDGIFVITPRMGPAFVEALPVRKFHGVGPATAARMEAIGIHTGADLKSHSADALRACFGKSGPYYFALARGIDTRAVQPDQVRKSAGAENTFAVDLTTIEQASAALAPLVEKVWRFCTQGGIHGRTVTLKVKYADFRQITRSRTAIAPIATEAALGETALALLAPIFPPRKPIRLLGVSLSGLGDGAAEAAAQLTLGV